MRQTWIACGLLVAVLCFVGGLRGQELQLRATTGQQVHEDAEAKSAHSAAVAESFDFPHPTLSAHSEWAGLLSALILVFFALAVIIGVLTDIDRAYAPADESDDLNASHGHGSHGTVAAHGHH